MKSTNNCNHSVSYVDGTEVITYQSVAPDCPHCLRRQILDLADTLVELRNSSAKTQAFLLQRIYELEQQNKTLRTVALEAACYRHMTEPDHDSENFRGCTHPVCKRAKTAINGGALEGNE